MTPALTSEPVTIPADDDPTAATPGDPAVPEEQASGGAADEIPATGTVVPDGDSQPGLEQPAVPEPAAEESGTGGVEEGADSAEQPGADADGLPSEPAVANPDDSVEALSEGQVSEAASEAVDSQVTAPTDAGAIENTSVSTGPTAHHSVHEDTADVSAAHEFITQIQSRIHSTIDTIKAQVTTAVTNCLCNVVDQVQVLVGMAGNAFDQLTSPQSSGGSAPQPDNPATWAVVAWVRKQIDNAVTAFNESPVGVWLRDTVSRVEDAWVDLGNSPIGRTFSAQLTALLEQCEDSTELPSELERTVLVSGLTEPTDFELLAHHSDHVQLILIAEKSGAIKAYDPETESVTTLITLDVVTADGERGLLGLAVDPNFWHSGEEGYRTIYAAYTNAENYDQLSSFTMSESLDSLGNENVMVTSTLPAHEFHHGGELEFDPSGQHLYWAVGNNVNDPAVFNSQDLTNIHGKILRLNRDGTPAADNPFIDAADPNTQLIYAYGFRNPFRFDFAPDGTLLAGDVGEASWEELNVIVPGGNYGWPHAEGVCDGCGYINPLYAYPHSEDSGSGSITSVLVYAGDALGDQYTNKVFIADYSLGWIREVTVDEQFASVIGVRTFDATAGTVVKLAEGPDGHIYQLDIYPGALSVIAPSGGNRAPTAVITSSATSTAADTLTVEFSGADSSDPDAGDALSYQWDFGNGATSTEANPTATFTKGAGDEYTPFTVTLTVSDGDKSSQTTQRIVVGSTPPTAAISVSESTYDAGDTISFSAIGTDDQDGSLPEDAYDWTIEFHHLDHKHPFLSGLSGSTGTMTVPVNTDQLDTTFYRITLTVTDSSGLSTTQHVDVNPNLVELTFGANDPNATYTLDGIPRKGTYTEMGVVGVVRALGAVSPQTVDGQQLVFESWSDGGAAAHTVTVPSTATSYTVTYTAAAL
ncbi:MAG: PQQ-dependent sugar dehydrogenase [Actinomycetota bacterium]|nr:PQQ-dependent sugar dehydrogenase [Actinomycetota bacterium]